MLVIREQQQYKCSLAALTAVNAALARSICMTWHVCCVDFSQVKLALTHLLDNWRMACRSTAGECL